MLAHALVPVVALLSFIQPETSGPALQPAQTAAPAMEPGPFRVERVFSVGGDGGWDCVTFDPESGRLYVPRATHVMVIDPASGTVVGDVPDTAGVHCVAVGLGKGYTSNGKAGTVTVFDLKTLAVEKTIKAGENPDAILFEPTTTRVFCFNGKSNDVTVINAQDGSVAGTIPVGGKPELTVADGQGTVFVNVEDTNELIRIDARELRVVGRFPLTPGEGPTGLAIDAAHKRLFAACTNQKMVALDATSGKVLGAVDIGKGVDGADFDPAGPYAVTSNGEGTLSVISTKDDHFQVVQTLATAPGARTIAADPKNRRFYLVTAEFEPPKPAAPGAKPARPAMKPGTFKLVVVGVAAAR